MLFTFNVTLLLASSTDLSLVFTTTILSVLVYDL